MKKYARKCEYCRHIYRSFFVGIVLIASGLMFSYNMSYEQILVGVGFLFLIYGIIKCWRCKNACG